MIRAVIFDMYETLITHYRCPLYFSGEMAADAGIQPEIFRALWRATEDDRSLGKVTVDEVVEDILKQCNSYSEAIFNTIMKKRISTKKRCFETIHEEIIPMFEMLKNRGIKIGLISNCFSEEAQVIKESVLWPFFDTAYLSYEQGMMKPDERIFLNCIKELQVKPEECLYVGDGGSQELEAAQDVGMKAVQAFWYWKEESARTIKRKEGFELMNRPMEIMRYLE